MKLWMKQTLLALFIILLSVSACLYFFVAIQTNSLLDTARENAEKNLNPFIGHLSTLDSTSAISHDADNTIKTSLVQYTFATYAHLLQSAENCYSLVLDGDYLYNITPYDPQKHLSITENTSSASRMLKIRERPWLLLASRYEVLSIKVIIYYLQDISAIYRAIDTLTRIAQLALVCCLTLSGIALPLVLRRTLKPLHKLSHMSEQIASGQYALRSELQTGDEVGELSHSFDQMAETVEQKILTLEDAAQRRELLLGALTHEIKTPMTAIIGFSDSLLSMPLSEEERMEAVYEIHEAAVRTEHLNQKMMQLISMTDCPMLVKRRLSVGALFEQAGNIVAPMLADKHLTLNANIYLDTIEGDNDLLTSLLTNLIDNAIKASDEGKGIMLSAYLYDNWSCLQVTDEGAGIPADKISLVTEPFYRVDKARSRKLGGAGLGLSLCKMIAQAHGGHLEIESKLGSGTTIRAYLPLGQKEDCHEKKA